MRHLVVTDSDIIESIGFEQPMSPSGMVGSLEIVFKTTPDIIYRYEHVTVTDFAKLVSAESIGKSFHEMFRKTKHPFTKSERKPTLKK
jgi:hypothetical protein